MWRTSVSEAVDVGGDGGHVDAVMLGTLRQELGVVDPLGAGENLLPTHEHVVAASVNCDHHCYLFCEAQGKGRAKGRPRKVTQRSFIDGGWWMVDILSLMLYIKFGCVTFHRKSLNLQD